MIDDIASCVESALSKDLPDIPVYIRDEIEGKRLTFRRPTKEEIFIYSFPQMWGSTALGFGGIGGQAVTMAQTTVVIYTKLYCLSKETACVYFGSRLAYKMDDVNDAFYQDLKNLNMCSVDKHEKYKSLK